MIEQLSDKLVYALVVVPQAWLWHKINKTENKVYNMFSKDEVDKLIDLKNKPIQEALERNNNATDRLVQAVEDLRVEMAKRGR